MGSVRNGRWSADLAGDFAVFLIGARINRLRAVRSWWPVLRAMPRMIEELEARPELGLLGHYGAFAGLRDFVLIQYWRSFEHLHAYARARERAHLPAWAEYNRLVRDNDAVGIWHETYLVRAGEYEAIYGNMPTHGLGAAREVELGPAVGRRTSALGRLGRSAGDDQPLDPAGREVARETG